MINLEHGALLVQIARNAIKSKFSVLPFRVDRQTKEIFSDPHGCFVTLHKDGEMRGSMGYSEPTVALWEAVVSSAKKAAFEDPRFAPLSKQELSSVTVEVSIMSKPKRVDVRNPEHYLKHIKVGKTGILIRGTFSEGMLLPQVATENGWDALTFLRQACLKAQLGADDWQDFDNCRVYLFLSSVFGEHTPQGEVVQVM